MAEEVKIAELQRENNDLRFRIVMLALCLVVALILIVVIMVHYKGCSQ